jgi:hypothetical protein
MKTVLIISYSPLHTDPRIQRQIKALVDKYKIITIGNESAKDDRIIHYNTFSNEIKKNTIKYKIIIRLKFLSYLLRGINYFLLYFIPKIFQIEFINNNIKENPDVIIANDWNGLYLASELKRIKKWEAKIYFDAHEYAPKEYNSIKWRLTSKKIINYTLKKCRDDISIMSTVCDGIAREYEKYFSFPVNSVKIITNATGYNDAMKPEQTGDKIKLIHHGGAMKVRKLELMIKMMKYLDPTKYELTFMLVKNDSKYYNKIIKLAKKYENIKFAEPVPFVDIVKTINSYDIGVFLLLPEIFNYKYALPNKLFEYIQARLAIAIGPSIEMAKVVEKYSLGAISEKFTPKSLADSIKEMTIEKIMDCKKNSDKCARELSAEENMIKIKQIVDELAK